MCAMTSKSYDWGLRNIAKNSPKKQKTAVSDFPQFSQKVSIRLNLICFSKYFNPFPTYVYRTFGGCGFGFQVGFIFRGRARSYAGVEAAATNGGPLISFNIDAAQGHHNATAAANDVMHYGGGGGVALNRGVGGLARTGADKYLDVKDTVDTLAHLMNQHTSKTTATQEACLDWLFKLYSTVPYKVILISQLDWHSHVVGSNLTTTFFGYQPSQFKCAFVIRNKRK